MMHVLAACIAKDSTDNIATNFSKCASTPSQRFLVFHHGYLIGNATVLSQHQKYRPPLWVKLLQMILLPPPENEHQQSLNDFLVLHLG
jgi:hypothetical protein